MWWVAINNECERIWLEWNNGKQILSFLSISQFEYYSTVRKINGTKLELSLKDIEELMSDISDEFQSINIKHTEDVGNWTIELFKGRPKNIFQLLGSLKLRLDQYGFEINIDYNENGLYIVLY